MAPLRRENGVWVAVYVEKPRHTRLLPSSNQLHHHHHQHHRHQHRHHHHHVYLHRARQPGPRGRGYSRRAELLEYSRQLRESARSTASTPLLRHLNPESHSNQRSPKQKFPAKHKPKIVRTPTCFGEWKSLISIFRRSSYLDGKEMKGRTNFNTIGTKIKAIMKSFQVNKNKGFTSKVIASLKKYR